VRPSASLRRRLVLVGALLGAAIAVAEAITALDCASAQRIALAIGGSFGGGAAFAALVQQLRGRG
jgi:hypothetical protein